MTMRQVVPGYMVLVTQQWINLGKCFFKNDDPVNKINLSEFLGVALVPDLLALPCAYCDAVVEHDKFL